VEKLATIQMVEVWLPMVDGRWLVMPRHTQPEPDVQALLNQIRITLPSQPPPRITNPFQQALIFAGLGNKERTLNAIERMAAFGPVRLGRDLTYPEFALARGDPQVKALRKKVGLPE
jgi:hypothetical protein